MGPHIVSAFDSDLQLLNRKIAEMGGLAEEQLSNALKAIAQRDVELSAEVIKRDKKLDEMEMEIEEAAIRTLALRQPVASDLRDTVAALKVASTLERIGDLSKSIARCTEILIQHKPLLVVSPVVRMGRQVLSQFSEVLDAYTSRDTALAVSVWRRDVEVDVTYNSLFREILTYMMEDPRTIGVCSQLMFVAKNLERIGDHATFIAEMTYYIVEGEPLGDDRPKGEPVGADFPVDIDD